MEFLTAILDAIFGAAGAAITGLTGLLSAALSVVWTANSTGTGGTLTPIAYLLLLAIGFSLAMGLLNKFLNLVRMRG